MGKELPKCEVFTMRCPDSKIYVRMRKLVSKLAELKGVKQWRYLLDLLEADAKKNKVR